MGCLSSICEALVQSLALLRERERERGEEEERREGKSAIAWLGGAHL